jgi:hypothetical protein
MIGQVPIKWNSVGSDALALETKNRNTISTDKPPLQGSSGSHGEIFSVTPKISVPATSFGGKSSVKEGFKSISSPILPILQSRGVSRGGTKKRSRIDKDLIDSSKKKVILHLNIVSTQNE